MEHTPVNTLSASPVETARTSSAGAPATTEHAPKRRDPWMDNARLLAAILICVMHFAQAFREQSAALDTFYYATWSWRLPVYILVAGYFSQSTALSGRRAVQLLRNILFVYLVFDALAFVQIGVLYETWNYNPIRPSFTLWFLLSLFSWRLTLPLFAKVRFILPISFGVSIFSGFMASAGPDLSIGATLGFWPIFLLGWALQEVPFREVLSRPAGKVFGIGVIILSFVIIALVRPGISPYAFSMTYGYRGERFLEQLPHAGIRVLVLIYGVLGVAAILSLVPQRQIKYLTYAGSGSFYIYLLHPLIIRALNGTETMPQPATGVQLILFLIGAAIIGLLLGSQPIRKVTRFLIQPRYTWLFTKEPDPLKRG